MDNKEFARLRKKLGKTQKEMAQLLGVSIKAVHSYEQGWRSIPAHAERQMLFLISNKRGDSQANKPCWVTKKCPPKKKKECPAWEFKSGKLCWFINGTICDGVVYKDWRQKMKSCRSCEVFTNLL
jgi:hypothetical protein